MKACVLIPAYNASGNIAALVKNIKDYGLDVLVVDDGSEDQTGRIAESRGAEVIRNADNLGKGGALRRGFEYLRNKPLDAIITMDADGQHDPSCLGRFIEAAQGNGPDIIVGNRMASRRDMPFLRIWTNRLMSWFLSRKTGQRIPDSQCGFRLIKKAVLEKINLVTSNYEIESELLIKASMAGFKIGSVTISSIYRGQKSRINPVVDTIRFIKMIRGGI